MAQQSTAGEFISGALFGPSVADQFAAPMLTCGCPACAAIASQKSNGTSPHVRAAAFATAASDHRSYAVLSQTVTPDGNGSFTGSFSGDRNIDAVLIGSKIVSTDLTYTFPTSGTDYGNNYDSGQADRLLPFNEMQQAAARAAFAMVAKYTQLTFREVTPAESADDRATFRLAQTTSATVISAMGRFPHSADEALGQNPSGDIWFGRTEQPYYTNPAKGNWGYVTVLHEIGHTLGLKHGGDDYSGFDLADIFGSATPVYGTRALDWAKDGQLWSLMTYSTAPNTRNAYNGDEKNQATSYMMYDIAALQYLYGANYTTNAGDTVYRWDPTTGEGFVNGVGQGRPTGNKVLETVWDGGGNDTYDLSNYDGGVSIDLRPGATSVLSAAQLPNAEAYLGYVAPMQGSVANALLYKDDGRSLIENAVGGAGNDILIGNRAANLLVGNAGDDAFDGMEGSDTIIGGAGSDTVSFSTATTAITLALDNGRSDIRVANGGDVDVLRSIENIVGTAHDDTLVGDDGDNMLSGGAGGRDTLRGGDGDDRLVGGGFRLDLPDRPDVVKTAGTVNGSIATAVLLDGSFDLAPRYGVADAATIPHATIVGTVAQDGYEYYGFTGKAGAAVSLDVDLADGTLYPGLLLFDGAGTQIAANYESLKRDEGSNLAADPKIDFVLPADGLYYVAITNSAPARQGFVSTDLPVGFKYVLNVSVEQAAVPAPTLLETGAAYLDGGAGDDMLVTAMGDDTVLGGAGSDTVSFEQSYKGIAVDLRVTDGQDTGAGLDRIAGVENVLGSRQADVIVGDGGDNVIDGFTGDDTLVGGAGTDTLSFARQVQGIRYDLTGQGAAETVRLGEDVTASGFENVRGSAFDDVLAGDAGANVIDGGAGDDQLSGDGLGRTGGGVDMLIGGTGTDLASFAAHAQDITARLDTGTALAGGAVIATLREIENLEGGSGDDALTGDAGANLLSGNAGNDRVSGGAGDDILSGGAGDDVLDGGDGTDMAIYDGAGDVTVDLRLTGAQQTGQGLDTLRGIENLWLGTGNSQVTGDGGANLFRDGGGNDAIDGGSGSDTVDYSRAKAAVTVDLSLTAAQATGSGIDRLTGIENLIGSRFDDQLFGDGGSNRLAGGGGGDFIVGGDGTDTIDGGDGNDILLGDANSIADLGQSGRNDTISGGAGRDVVIGGQGDDVLSGGTGNDYIISGSAKIDADAGGYYLDLTNFADGGNDVIDGGDGVDRATLTFEGRREAVALDLSDSSRVNILYSGGNAVGSVTGIEKVWIFSGSGDDRFVGTAGDDQLRGGAGDDQLIGGLGDDYLVGGSGNDLIDGGEGFDTFDIGYEATGGSRIDLRLTGPQDTGVMGTETIRGIEKIVTSQFTDIIIGGDENLAANDDRGGADSFYGNGGNDTLEVVRYAENETAAPIVIDGGTGNDNLRYSSGLIPGRGTDGLYTRYLDTVTLTGGAGDDFIKSWGARSIVIDAGEGNDVVGIGINGRADQTAFDITLGAGQDELAIQWGGGDIAMYDRSANIVRDFQAGAGGDLLGLTAIVSQGLYDSAGDPAMIGTFSPFLSGHVTLVKQGGDTLLQADMDGRFGPAGWVTVMKLEGTNAFGFTTGNVYAYYVDETGNTQTVVYDPIITQYMAAGETRLDGHAGADSLQGAAGSDLLIGYGGDDFINGFAGNDTLVGGGGRDYLVGGNGDDVYYVDRADDYVQETWDEGTDRVVTSVDWTLDTNFEQIESLDGGLRLTGNYRDNVLYGSRNGADVLVGDYGNDTYVVRHADTTIVEDAYGGNDEVIVATASYTLTQGAMVEMMRAATGSDAIDMTGNEFDQMLVANAGANRLNGGGGIDIVSYRAATAGVVVNGATMTGTGGDATGDRYQNVEGFQGSDFADRLIAGNGGMTLDGRAGDDWLVGGTGNDTLFGGAGSDVFVFNTNGISGRDRVLDWSAGDRIATSKQLRGADSQGLITLGANGLVLLDGVLAGDTAELVDTGGAVLRAMGKQDGYWWYGFVSGGNPAFNGRVVEMASMDALTHAAAAAPANDGIAAHHAGDAGTGGGMSPFYVYDAMGDAMQSGVLLNA